MATRRYLNFDLLLEQGGDGQYEARVTASPVTDLPHARFRLPFDEKSLRILLLELDPGRTDVRGVGGSQQNAAKEFGGPLFEAIFTGKVALAWTRSLDKVAAGDAGGLRLRIRVDGEAADLAGLPWELLYDARDRAFPAQSEITPLVRFLDVASEAEPIQVSGPLRVLAIISSPVDLPELSVEREWARIQTAMSAKVRQGLVVVDRLPEATVDALGEWLLDHDTHVIHFVGHGDFDPAGGEGFIFFQNDRGGSDPVTADVLGPFVHDHDPLRMVVMNACRSARVGRTDPYGGMAQGLVQHGATAVVAMQFPITDPAAVMFTGKFYGALAAGLPVDQAVSYARKALQAKFRSEWATPVLFMRSPDGDLFQDLQAPSGWVPHEPSEPRHTDDDRDPVLDELPSTDLDVTDIASPDAADPILEPTQRDLPLAESDPYAFLFDPERPEPEHRDAEPEQPEPPGPDEPESVGGWVRAHLKLLAAAAAALLAVIALGIAVPLFGEDPPPSPFESTQMYQMARHLFDPSECATITGPSQAPVAWELHPQPDQMVRCTTRDQKFTAVFMCNEVGTVTYIRKDYLDRAVESTRTPVTNPPAGRDDPVDGVQFAYENRGSQEPRVFWDSSAERCAAELQSSTESMNATRTFWAEGPS